MKPGIFLSFCHTSYFLFLFPTSGQWIVQRRILYAITWLDPRNGTETLDDKNSVCKGLTPISKMRTRSQWSIYFISCRRRCVSLQNKFKCSSQIYDIHIFYYRYISNRTRCYRSEFLRVFGFLFWILSFLRPPQVSTKLLNSFTNKQTKCNANILIIIHLPMSILAAQEHVLAS